MATQVQGPFYRHHSAQSTHTSVPSCCSACAYVQPERSPDVRFPASASLPRVDAITGGRLCGRRRVHRRAHFCLSIGSARVLCLLQHFLCAVSVSLSVHTGPICQDNAPVKPNNPNNPNWSERSRCCMPRIRTCFTRILSSSRHRMHFVTRSCLNHSSWR